MRRTRHTRRIKHKRKHKRRTRRYKRKTRRTRKRRGGAIGRQVFGGGYKERLVMMSRTPIAGGNRPILAVSDYPPGFKKFTNRDKRRWKNVMKTQHKKKHRKK